MTKRELLDALQHVDDNAPVTTPDGRDIHVLVHADVVILTDVDADDE
jgi:hypothetical protein